MLDMVQVHLGYGFILAPGPWGKGFTDGCIIIDKSNTTANTTANGTAVETAIEAAIEAAMMLPQKKA